MLSLANVRQSFRKASPKPGTTRAIEGDDNKNESNRTFSGAGSGRRSLAAAPHDRVQKLEARDQLNKGVQAYKNARYEEAIEHFQEAVQLDPTYPLAAALSRNRLRATGRSRPADPREPEARPAGHRRLQAGLRQRSEGHRQHQGDCGSLPEYRQVRRRQSTGS